MAQNDQEKKILALVSEYFSDKKVLIVDTSKSSRASISKTLVALGAKTQNIFRMPTYEQAVEEINNSHPSIVISDYNLEHKSGLELVQHLSKHYPIEQDRLFVLCAATGTETSVCEAAEEEVDAYVLKPFTPNALTAILRRAVLTKLHPSEYRQLITKAREEISSKDFDKAVEHLENAKQKDKKPCLAFYYLGQVALEQKNDDLALEIYSQGLQTNPIHYKCLTGQFELLDSLGKKREAYHSVKKLTQHFPVSPQRLGRIMRLAVETRNYIDVERYYEIFKNIEQRSAELVRTVSAALVVCGKSLLQQGRVEDAVDALRKAGVSSARSFNILSESVMALLKFSHHSIAEEFMKMFDGEDQSKPAYKALRYRIADATEPPMQLVTFGRQLLREGAEHPDIYEILIKRSIEIDHCPAAEDLAHQAGGKFPHFKERFEKLVAQIQNSAENREEATQ